MAASRAKAGTQAHPEAQAQAQVPEEEALVEVFWKAFQGLTRKQRALFLEKWLSEDPQLAEDLGDMLLIEEARRESGEDVPLQAYAAQRMSKSK